MSAIDFGNRVPKTLPHRWLQVIHFDRAYSTYLGFGKEMFFKQGV
jgi:hypothetical protein